MRLYSWRARTGTVIRLLALVAVLAAVFYADRLGLLGGKDPQSKAVVKENEVVRERRAGDKNEYQIPLFEAVYPDRDTEDE
jgi:hypothetical protein